MTPMHIDSSSKHHSLPNTHFNKFSNNKTSDSNKIPGNTLSFNTLHFQMCSFIWPLSFLFTFFQGISFPHAMKNNTSNQRRPLNRYVIHHFVCTHWSTRNRDVSIDVKERTSKGEFENKKKWNLRKTHVIFQRDVISLFLVYIHHLFSGKGVERVLHINQGF